MTLKILTGNESCLIESKCTQAICFYHKVDLEMLHKSVTRSGSDIVIVFPGALASEEYQFELGQTLCQVPYDLTIFTHSSCLIAGVRYGVLNNYIKPKDIELLFYNPKESVLSFILVSMELLKTGLKVLWILWIEHLYSF